MRRFVLGWQRGQERSGPPARLVTYADDLVIVCRPGRAEQALQCMRKLMTRIALTVNEGSRSASPSSSLCPNNRDTPA